LPSSIGKEGMFHKTVDKSTTRTWVKDTQQDSST